MGRIDMAWPAMIARFQVGNNEVMVHGSKLELTFMKLWWVTNLFGCDSYGWLSSWSLRGCQSTSKRVYFTFFPETHRRIFHGKNAPNGCLDIFGKIVFFVFMRKFWKKMELSMIKIIDESIISIVFWMLHWDASLSLAVTGPHPPGGDRGAFAG